MPTLVYNSKPVQDLMREVSSTISAIQARLISKETTSKSERTRWHQLLSRANEMMKRISNRAKRELKHCCAQLKTLLQKLGGLEPRSGRGIRARPCPAH